jgi:hypothetical protein
MGPAEAHPVEPWPAGGPGVLRLPSGRLLRGRALGRPLPSGPAPTFGLYLGGRAAPALPWPARWLRWGDFRLPSDRAAARATMAEALALAGSERVEVACHGGRGRTGTALACIAVLDGVAPAEAVAFVRAGYDPRAVETPWQASYVAGFG